MSSKKIDNEEKGKKPHKNSNNAVGNFVIYGIWILGQFWKFGKADADRTIKDGTPVRVHQQISIFVKLGLKATYRIFERNVQRYNKTSKRERK